MQCLCLPALLLSTAAVITTGFAGVGLSSHFGRGVRTAKELSMSIEGAAESWEWSEDRSGSPSGNARSERLQTEARSNGKFVSGDSLHRLRKEVLEMREELASARNDSSLKRVRELEHAILDAQSVDAEFVYAVSLELMAAAEQRGDLDDAAMFKKEALEARKHVPQFNLEGLWVGKYGDHGYEMINVTYIGDTLVAHKVTGAKNVPKGEPSFQVDLDPNSVSPNNNMLQPIELSEDATKQWGTKHLARFSGIGQVSGQDFVNRQWMEGQLILVGDYFSFAWVPLGHQVFFGRPSAELTLKMLKESSGDRTRHHLERCMEETEHLHMESEVTSGQKLASQQKDYFDQEGCFE